MSKYRELSLKEISSQFWAKLDVNLHGKYDNVAVALIKNAGDKSYTYSHDEIQGFREAVDPVQRLLLDWGTKTQATIADLEKFFHSNRDFGIQPLELLQKCCGECLESSRHVRGMLGQARVIVKKQCNRFHPSYRLCIGMMQTTVYSEDIANSLMTVTYETYCVAESMDA